MFTNSKQFTAAINLFNSTINKFCFFNLIFFFIFTDWILSVNGNRWFIHKQNNIQAVYSYSYTPNRIFISRPTRMSFLQKRKKLKKKIIFLFVLLLKPHNFFVHATIYIAHWCVYLTGYCCFCTTMLHLVPENQP